MLFVGMDVFHFLPLSYLIFRIDDPSVFYCERSQLPLYYTYFDILVNYLFAATAKQEW